MSEIRIPDIGDFKDVEVIEVLVKPGDQIEQESGIITLETDKATMDVPSDQGGTVKELTVKVGDKVNQGDVIAILDAAAASAPSQDAPATAPETPPKEDAAPTSEAARQEKAPAKEEASSAEPQTITVPDIGDFKDVEVIEVLAQPGQDVAAEDGIITLETDKATMDVPTPVAGKIDKLLVKAGDKISQGDQIAVIIASASSPAKPAAPAADAPQTSPAPAAQEPAKAPAQQRASPSQQPSGNKAQHDKQVYASPAVRKLAREFGVNLTAITGTGSKGRIIKEDVQAYIKDQLSGNGSGGLGLNLSYELPKLEETDFSQQGPIEQVALSRVRQLSGPNLHRNWLSVPHVTQFDDADVTELEEFRKAHAAEAKARGFSLSPLAFLVKAVTAALRQFPEFNSSLHPDGKSLIIKKYYNIGIAVNTPGGLLVPVIKDTETKSVMQLAEEMATLSKNTREGKVSPKALRGGTFTVSSLGGIGGTHFTPIVNMPEVAILGVGKSRITPSWNGKEFVPRTLMPIALSYDHRAIDGAQGAQFITHLSLLMSDIRNIVL